MKIQVGEVKMQEVDRQNIVILDKETEEEQIIVPSKTTKYLVPCLKEYGQKFTNELTKVYKVAAGIGDAILINRDIRHEKHVFILLDGKAPTFNKHLHKFLLWIREQDYFVDDYVYGDIQKSTFHMIILKFPDKYYDSFKTFKIGDYSKMYQLGDIEKFFENHPTTKKVLIKDHNYRITFTRKLNKLFVMTGNHAIKPEEWQGELDLPPTDITEIFNHHLKLDNDTL